MSGISQELQNYHLPSRRGPPRAEEQQQYHPQTSRGRAARPEEERRAGSGHRRSARHDPPAYSVSSVRNSSPLCAHEFLSFYTLQIQVAHFPSLQSVSPQGCDSGPGATQRHSSRNPKSQLHWQAPPPARPRMDAFETATEAGGHYGSHGHREYSAGHRARSSHNPQPHHLPHHHHPNPTPYCQPITTVTASASVTVAVHPPPLSSQSPPASSYPGYTATDSYCPSGPEVPEPAFQDPHVPLETQLGARGVKVEAMELQDLEFEAAERNHGRQAS